LAKRATPVFATVLVIVVIVEEGGVVPSFTGSFPTVIDIDVIIDVVGVVIV
jgi:hypothetical protein